MLFHILGHIQPDQGLFGAEQLPCQSPAELGFAHAGGPQEQEGAHGAARVGDPHPTPAHCGSHQAHRLLLPDDALMKRFLQMRQPLALLGVQLLDIDPRCRGNDLRHIIRGHLGTGIGLRAFQFHLRPQPCLLVPEHRRRLIVLPGHSGVFLLQQPFELILHRLLLFRRLKGCQAHLAGGFIQQIQCLVRQQTVADIPGRQPHCRLDGLIRDAHLVMGFIALPQSGEDAHGIFLVRLLHQHRLEAALQGAVGFNMAVVLVQGGGADHLQFSPGQRRLEDIGGVDGSLGRAHAYNIVDLIDKEQHIPGSGHLRQHILHPVLKISPVFGACHHRSEIQRYQPLAPQPVRDLPGGNLPGKGFHNSGLAHTRLTDQAGVVLGAPAENPHHPLQFRLPPDHGINFPGSCQLGEVPGILIQNGRPG